MDLAAKFCEKVRRAYLEVYGEAPFDGEDYGQQPFTIGAVLVTFESHLIDGSSVSTIIYDASEITALGLASWTKTFIEQELLDPE